MNKCLPIDFYSSKSQYVLQLTITKIIARNKINRFPGSAQERQLRDDIFGANAQLNNIWAKSSRHN